MTKTNETLARRNRAYQIDTLLAVKGGQFGRVDEVTETRKGRQYKLIVGEGEGLIVSDDQVEGAYRLQRPKGIVRSMPTTTHANRATARKRPAQEARA